MAAKQRAVQRMRQITGLIFLVVIGVIAATAAMTWLSPREVAALSQDGATQQNETDVGVLRIAVASNFVQPMRVMVAAFLASEQTRLTQVAGGAVSQVQLPQIQIIAGSTGKHYAQIKHGAPFDVFFAADGKRPQLLEQEGFGIPGTRFVYAIGQLMLWSPQQRLFEPRANFDTVLSDAAAIRLKHILLANTPLAIANPKLAPYGQAAAEVLRHLGIWEQLQPDLVRGENIAQTYQFVASGTVQLGFIAASQLNADARRDAAHYWLLPEKCYSPIRQEALILRDSTLARAFFAFMHSKQAQSLIRKHGYSVP